MDTAPTRAAALARLAARRANASVHLLRPAALSGCVAASRRIAASYRSATITPERSGRKASPASGP